MSVTWYTGQSGAGKSTAARRQQQERGGILLDGDEMREVWPGLGFSLEDRYEQNMRVARLAHLLSDQGSDVIVATICPYRALRAECNFLAGGAEWVWVTGGRESDHDHPYEPPMDEPVRVLQGVPSV